MNKSIRFIIQDGVFEVPGAPTTFRPQLQFGYEGPEAVLRLIRG